MEGELVDGRHTLTMTPKIDQLIFRGRITLVVQAIYFRFESLPLGQLELWIKVGVGDICTILQAKIHLSLRIHIVNSEFRDHVLEIHTNINVVGSVPISSCRK